MTPQTQAEAPVELEPKHTELVIKFLADIRNGKIYGSGNVALATLTLLEQIIADAGDATASELCASVRSVGRLVSRALPLQLVATNIVRRVLKAIRDDQRASDQSAHTEGASLQRLVLGDNPAPAAPRAPRREHLREHAAELRLELAGGAGALAGLAAEHAHSDELLLAAGGGAILERWLKAAATRRCRLVIPHHAQTEGMAARLAAAGVPVTVVSAAAVAGLMSRVNKVVLGVTAVLASGALAPCGTAAVTLAAKHYNVPVLALAPLYKLSPRHARELQRLNALSAPGIAIPYESAESGECAPYAPRYDVVPADHITLFLTNLGGSSPSYVYRLLSELYDPSDYEL